MPLTNAQRQTRWRKRRASREKAAAKKIDRRDAEILELKAEIARLRSGLRWCSSAGTQLGAAGRRVDILHRRTPAPDQHAQPARRIQGRPEEPAAFMVVPVRAEGAPARRSPGRRDQTAGTSPSRFGLGRGCQRGQNLLAVAEVLNSIPPPRTGRRIRRLFPWRGCGLRSVRRDATSKIRPARLPRNK
jgi:hypothetical protein